MENSIQLPENIVKHLSNLPEQGMGYQIVNVILKNGRKLKRKVVLNSSILKVDKKEKISSEDILGAELAISE